MEITLFDVSCVNIYGQTIGKDPFIIFKLPFDQLNFCLERLPFFSMKKLKVHESKQMGSNHIKVRIVTFQEAKGGVHHQSWVAKKHMILRDDDKRANITKDRKGCLDMINKVFFVPNIL